MANNISPPRSPKRSSLARRSIAPTTQRSIITPDPLAHSLARPILPIVPTGNQTPSIPPQNYNSPLSPTSPAGAFTYPPIRTERPPPAMAPTTALARSNGLAVDLPPSSTTPTGRISKAKKGKRVHACEFPGCGKVFTRAEHRRRHELNHNPNATYQCKQPGCNKSFHRIDLLQRHQERHELEATAASSPAPGGNTPYSEPPTSMAPGAMTSPQTSASGPRPGSMSIPSLIHQVGGSGLGLGGLYPPYVQSNGWDSEDIYYHPETHPLDPRCIRQPSVSSSSSVTDFVAGGSPMVRPALPSNWLPATAHPSSLSPNMYGGDDYTSSPAATPVPIPLSDLDGYEYSVIRRELSAVPGLVSSPGRTGLPDTIRWHCLELYWHHFHPTLPIVHRPTFFITQPSPLLASAMVAIGSYYDEELDDAKQYSLALLEIATKILRKRSNITSRSRISDLQTVVLLEILSTFCARQISVQMSTRFRALFANLNSAQHWLTQSPLAVFRTLREDRTQADISKAHKFFVEHETRSRILHACSVLDNLQATLFEQQPTIRKHSNNLQVNTNAASAIHLPCDDYLWEASPIEKWVELAANHEYFKLLQGKPIPARDPDAFSFFQLQVIAASGAGEKASAKGRIQPSLQVFTQSSFNHHLGELCRHVRVRSLLTVAGESWVLGHKVEKEADFQHAKQDLRKWLDSAYVTKRSAPADCLVAHWHALKILRGLTQVQVPDQATSSADIFGSTGMVHENWAVYLASLVCWAHSFRRSSTISINGMTNSPVVNSMAPASTPSLSHPAFIISPARAAQEAQSYLIFTDLGSPNALRDLDAGTLARTQGLLETVRVQKLARGMVGGLMNDAERVLRKIVEGKSTASF